MRAGRYFPLTNCIEMNLLFIGIAAAAAAAAAI